MIQRAPRWMWLALGAVASVLTAIGIALAIPNGEGSDGTKAAEVKVDEGRVARVSLRGFENCSDEVDLTLGPVKGRNFFLGSSDTLVRWLDYSSEEGPITKWWGSKGGRICFLGPIGETITVRQTPS